MWEEVVRKGERGRLQCGKQHVNSSQFHIRYGGKSKIWAGGKVKEREDWGMKETKPVFVKGKQSLPGTLELN